MEVHLNNNSQTSRPIEICALIFSLLALCASLISLLAPGPATIWDRVVAIAPFLLSQGSARFVNELPIVRMYAVLWPMYLVFFVFLVAITYYEFRQQVIPDAVTIPGIVIGMGFVAGFRHISLIDSVSGVAFGLGGLWALNAYWVRTKGRVGLGAGIMKMQAMLGAFLGLQNSISALCLASILGAIYLVSFRRYASEPLEFGPWLAIAGLFCALVPVSAVLR